MLRAETTDQLAAFREAVDFRGKRRERAMTFVMTLAVVLVNLVTFLSPGGSRTARAQKIKRRSALLGSLLLSGSSGRRGALR